MKTKLNILQICFLILSCLPIEMYAQSFEGKIIYAEQYQSIDLKNKALLDTVTLLIKSNKLIFKHTLFNFKEGYNCYLNKKHYAVDVTDERISFDISDTTGNKFDKKYRTLVQTKDLDTINGYPCKKYLLRVLTDLGTDDVTYWIADNWKADQSFSDYSIENIGIVLKRYVESPNGIMFSSPIEIIPMKLDDKLFELPNYPISKINFEKMK